MGFFVVAGFVLTSKLRSPSAIAELLVIGLSSIVTSGVVNTIDFLLLGSGNDPLYFGNYDEAYSLYKLAVTVKWYNIKT